MTLAQLSQLQAAKLNLFYKAVLYTLSAVENGEESRLTNDAGYALAIAAKQYVRTAYAIEPALGEPVQTFPE